MKWKPARLAMAAVAAIASSALLIAPAASAAPRDPDALNSVTKQSVKLSKEDRKSAEDYWTPEKMKAAVPIETRYGMKAAAPEVRERLAASDATRATPRPQLGKVFFTLSGVNYVCSGTATQSTNGDVVTTAGHCLNEGPGAFATNFVFVPAYNNGSAPYGKWSAERLLTTTAWASRGDMDYDVGFAVMGENSAGRSLTSVTGSYPIAFNLARGLSYTSYGYPAGSPYNGEVLWSCSGTVKQDTFGGSSDQGLPCSMTGGSSGGGWITGGRLNSVNSFKYNYDSGTMYGPYFGTTIQNVYNRAAVA